MSRRGPLAFITAFVILDSMVWLAFAALIGLELHPALPESRLVQDLMILLALGVCGALPVLLVLARRFGMVPALSLILLLTLICVLTLFDEVGPADVLVLIAHFVPLLLLIISLNCFPDRDRAGESGSGDSPEDAETKSTVLGLIGDVHADDQTLRRVVDFLKGAGADLILCSGDLADGPGSLDECCRIFQKENVLTVAGNHDRWLLNGEMRVFEDGDSLGYLQKETIAYLQALPVVRNLTPGGFNILLCHGVGTNDMAQVKPHDEGYAIESNTDLQVVLADQGVDLMIAGHSHMRMVRRFDSLTIVNAGTILQEKSPGFGLMNMKTRTVEFFSISDSEILPAETELLEL